MSRNKIAYLIQSETGINNYKIPKESDIYILKWSEGKPMDDSIIYRPFCTWSTGRNELYKIASEKNDYLYYIYMDDDVEFVDFSLEDFEVAIRRPGLTCPRYAFPKITNDHQFYKSVGTEETNMLYGDHLMMAVRWDIAAQMPYSNEFDNICWWAGSAEWSERYRGRFGLTGVCFGWMNVFNSKCREYPKIYGKVYKQEFLLPELNDKNLVYLGILHHWQGAEFMKNNDYDSAIKEWESGASYGNIQCVSSISDLQLVRFKEKHELDYWKNHIATQGNNNLWYAYWFTDCFGLTPDYYQQKKVLDIGCGPLGSLEWADMALERVGLDPLADEYRKIVATCHKMIYVKAPAESIPFPDAYFDIVSSFNSIDHVVNVTVAIKEIARVLKPEGLFLLLTDLGHEPTPCEPQEISWEIINELSNFFEILEDKHFEKRQEGVYQSILEAIPYDHHNTTKRYGVLYAKLKKYGMTNPSDEAL